VVGARHQQHRPVRRLLQTELVRRIRATLAVPQSLNKFLFFMIFFFLTFQRLKVYLEDVSVELAELVLEGLALREHALLVSEQPVLAHAHQLHLVGQTQDLVQFPLAAVLRRHLNLKKIHNQFSKL
jgi:hypothetical protein